MHYYTGSQHPSLQQSQGSLFPTEHGGGVDSQFLSQEGIKMNLEKKSGDSFPIVLCSVVSRKCVHNHSVEKRLQKQVTKHKRGEVGGGEDCNFLPGTGEN